MVRIFKLQEWGLEFYNQESSQSSGGGFSMATPSPSPLTPTPPATAQHVVLNSFENIPSPNHNIHTELSPFNYLEVYSSQQSPVKLTPLTDDLALDYCNATADGVTPLKNNVNTRQFIKTRK